MTQHYTDWSSTVKHDFIDSFLGKFISLGSARDVYEVVGNPDQVIKIETTKGSFQNVIEWDVWQNVHWTPWKGWFAPCIRISSCGTILIQTRTTPLPPERYPREVPDFMTDLKPANFGLYKGRVVAHDYAFNMFTARALRNARMRKVNRKEFASRER